VPEFNAIMDEYDTIADNGWVPDALVQRVNDTVKPRHAWVKKEAKEGGTSKPSSTLDAVMVLVKQVKKQNEILTGLEDVFRARK
jgi:hypothetical protein